MTSEHLLLLWCANHFSGGDYRGTDSWQHLIAAAKLSDGQPLGCLSQTLIRTSGRQL